MAAVRRPAQALPADVRWMQAGSTACLALALLVFLIMAALLLARSNWVPVRGVEIEGDLTHNALPALRAAVLPALAGTFYTLDLHRARAAFEAVPWVRRAVVRRAWPDRIRVHLEEHRPAAIWEGIEGDERLVNTHGEVFQANLGDVEDDGLPQLSGPPGSSARVLSMYGQLQSSFKRLNLNLERLALSDRGSWRAEFQGPVSVELGRGSDVDVLVRADRFVRTAPQVTQEFRNPFIHADLRHPDGYAIRLRGVTTSASTSGGPARKP